MNPDGGRVIRMEEDYDDEDMMSDDEVTSRKAAMDTPAVIDVKSEETAK